MFQKNKDLAQVELIYKKIFRIYPFLTAKQKNIFKQKSYNIIDGFKRNKLTAEDTIKKMLSSLGKNGHADIKEYHKPDRSFMCKVRSQKMPSFEIKNRILRIKIPSWLVWLGRIDKKLIGFCQKNIKKYDAIIIDVRENQGGSSRIAHDFAGIFFKKQIVFGKFVKIGKNGKLINQIGKLHPNGKIFIDKPIAILISKKCFSSNELFLAPFKISKRAVLIGESTAGGSANPISEIVKISGKNFVVRIPTWRYFLKGAKQPIEKTKIHPDILYKRKDIERFAENYLRKNILTRF